jgi:hypothetical protein
MVCRIIVSVGLLILVFMLGLAPMQATSGDNSALLADPARQLHAVRLENTLASAAIDAQRGDYEQARQAASDFFAFLREEASKGAESAFSQLQTDGMQSLLAHRDQIITLLARGDAASAELLSGAYVSFRKVMSK